MFLIAYSCGLSPPSLVWGQSHVYYYLHNVFMRLHRLKDIKCTGTNLWTQTVSSYDIWDKWFRDWCDGKVIHIIILLGCRIIVCCTAIFLLITVTVHYVIWCTLDLWYISLQIKITFSLDEIVSEIITLHQEHQCWKKTLRNQTGHIFLFN